MKRTIFASICAVLLLAGCETIEGAGRDVQAAGEAVTGTAQEAQQEM
jgi:predicted small secreted protein